MGKDIDWDELTFSLTPTDTMYVATTTAEDPWMPGDLRPYGNISISPAAGVLNYGQGLFEGMKAYRTAKNRVVFFRPDENARRMQRGADRLKMPPVPESIFLDAVEQVVQANIDYLPPMGRGAMYVRPLLMGSGPVLGVAPAPSYSFMIYVTPVGPYFKGGMKAIDLLISDEFHRAAPGGSGGVKAIGNYAPGMMPSMIAKSKGYAEVIYLDARTSTYIEEVGAANFFCVKDNVLYTPELTGTILPGITRASIIALARHLGYDVHEEKVSAEFAMSADEAFCCGTAAVISPIGSITHDDKKVTYGDGTPGIMTTTLYDMLTGIQNEKQEDIFGWLHEVPLD
ncbi:branched-chain amino acid aminotransferase [Candidatus Poseidoniales archaeon]|nr:branched-chain amino acid aminotransferase [Candidatus Poseidoniales archaeon]|tara:strand:- start:80 stop:1102 length:1023 start_codon:yes stop_codon:yes gene_type:complete